MTACCSFIFCMFVIRSVTSPCAPRRIAAVYCLSSSFGCSTQSSVCSTQPCGCNTTALRLQYHSLAAAIPQPCGCNTQPSGCNIQPFGCSTHICRLVFQRRIAAEKHAQTTDLLSNLLSNTLKTGQFGTSVWSLPYGTDRDCSGGVRCGFLFLWLRPGIKAKARSRGSVCFPCFAAMPWQGESSPAVTEPTKHVQNNNASQKR